MIYFATGLPVGTGIFILNIPIMIACYKFMGRRYTLLSIVGTIMLSVLADATSFLSTWQIMDDPMLSSITGGILSGIGFGIIYKYNGNSGGLDVIGAIVKKYYSLEMGTVTMILNLVILSAAAYMFSLERAVLTFVAIYIAAFITNKVVLGLKQRKSVLIISNRSTPIAQVLMRYIGHGATYIHGQGAYTMQDKRVIYAVIKLTEVAKVKEIVNKLDPQAFMIISDASEVVGRGFTSSPVKFHQYPAMPFPCRIPKRICLRNIDTDRFKRSPRRDCVFFAFISRRTSRPAYHTQGLGELYRSVPRIPESSFYQ